MRISFLWYCPEQADYDRWRDGLWAALEIIKKDHEVQMVRRPDAPNAVKTIKDFNPDVLLCWGALTENHWENILPFIDVPKVLCFAGGATEDIRASWFDKILVESDDWEEAFTDQGYSPIRAFGTNTKLYKPMTLNKEWSGIYPATFAAWKRHDIFAKALKGRGLAVGRKQPGIEEWTWQGCLDEGVNVMEVVHPEELVKLYNKSHFTVLTSSYWGGSQRQALESLSCNVPVICLSDGKPAEYVRESGCGAVLERWEDIMPYIEANLDTVYPSGREYILEKYSEEGYTKSIMGAIESIV